MSELVGNLRTANTFMELSAAELQAGGLVGLEEEARMFANALYAGEHVLLEGDPANGKTRMAKNWAQMIESLPLVGDEREYPIMGRAQGAPDRQPSDILGAQIYNQKTNDFETREGPVVAHFAFMDEINRNSPKTMAAINEAAEEGQITIGDSAVQLPGTFTVIGTQNHHEIGAGTQPMPAALADRFGATIMFEDPSPAELDKIGLNLKAGMHTQQPDVVLNMLDFVRVRKVVDGMKMDDSTVGEVTRIVNALRSIGALKLTSGSGIRATRAGINMARANALLNGEPTVKIDHVHNVMPAVLLGKIVTRADDFITPKEKQDLIRKIIDGQRV